jgi:hypothetical protein
MIVLELICAILQFILNLILAVWSIPFIPIVWIIREIKGTTPVAKDMYGKCPNIKLNKKDER